MIIRTLIALCVLSVMSTTRADALSVTPLQIDMQIGGGASYATVVARNTSDRTVSLETTVERRVITAEGSQTLTLDEDNVLVFPPLARLAPGASQAFRVQWIGEPQGGDYYVTVAQLPITSDEENLLGQQGDASLRLRLGYAFKIALRVSPAGARAELSATPLGAAVTSDGARALRLAVANNGGRSTSLSGFSLILTRGGEQIEILPSAWSDRMPVQLFPAGSERVVEIPVPDASWSTGVNVQFKPIR